MANPDPAARGAATPGQLATHPGALDRTSLELLGLFGKSTNLTALLRLPNGTIRRVRAGDTLRGERVLAIDADGVMMERGGRTRRLIIPSG